MNKKRWRNAGLYALLFIVVIALGTAFFDKQAPTRDTWRYAEFIQNVENNKVAQVRLSADRSTAIVKTEEGNQIVVKLIDDDPTMIDTLTKNGVDISVLPSDEKFWFKALSSLFFPVLLLVGLFFVGLLFFLIGIF